MGTNVSLPSIDGVRTYSEGDPCGQDTAAADGTRLEYFLGVERYRYASAPSSPDVAQFEQFAGKRVLEIGCGLGPDGAQFARAGAEYVGVDLTQAALDLARENFEVRGLPGQFVRVDAEQLPFRTEVRHFDRTRWPFLGRLISEGRTEAVGRHAGWLRMVYAQKPAS
jgi:SAM-dependent methyltransferase